MINSIKQLFSHYYGLLCVQLLANTVDVGFLAYFGSLNAYRDGQVQGDSLSVFLYKMIMQKAGQGRNRASRVVEVFGGARAIRRGNLLSSVGGFTAQNAQMLARLLWEDRKMFTAVSVHMGPGRRWASLMFLLLIHVFANGLVLF